MCDAEHALAKDMVKVLATWLNTEVQRPIMQALERTKTARAEVAERARANSELVSALATGAGNFLWGLLSNKLFYGQWIPDLS